MRQRSVALRAITTVTAIANVNFVLARRLGSPVPLDTAMISELSVAGLPAATWFRLGDGLTGVGAIVLSVLKVAGPGPDPARRRTAVCLAAFGFGDLVAALVPLPCAAAIAVCSPRNMQSRVHNTVSGVGVAAAAVGSAALARHAFQRRDHRRGSVLPMVAALGIAVGGAWQLVAMILHRPAGSAQRWQVAAISLWLGLEGVLIARDHARDATRR